MRPEKKNTSASDLPIYEDDSFIGLKDTPSSYIGMAGMIVKVALNEKGLLFALPEDSGDSTFLTLPDTPSDYDGSEGYYVRVNAAGDALEFVQVTPNTPSYLDLTDTPSSYVGQAGLVPYVNATEDALEFNAVPMYDDTIIQAEVDANALAITDLETDKEDSLGLGTANQVLRTNAAGDAKEWATISPGIGNDTGGTTSTISAMWAGTQAELDLITQDPTVMYVVI